MAAVWKHIGLHGHSVGSFTCEPNRVVWKSAIEENSSKSIGNIQQAQWTVFGQSGHLRLRTDKQEFRFDGFPATDFGNLQTALQETYGVSLEPHSVSSAGTQYGLTKLEHKALVFQHCVLDEMNEEGQEFEPRAEDEMMTLDLTQVTQCVLPGNNRNEIEVQFPESDAVEAGTDQLVSIRFYIPPVPDAEPEEETPAELLQQAIMKSANIRKTTGDLIVGFDQNKGTFLTPRGRYAMELYASHVRLRGQKYDYKIRYDDINRLFLLPKPDEVHMAFVIALDKPIRQGQQRYQSLVLQATKDPDEIHVHMEEEALEKEYKGELQPVMRGALSNLVAKSFKVIAGKKVFVPGKFSNANEQPCVKCAVRANEGLLYPLEKQFVFIHKPCILVRFNEIESVEFQRYGGGQGSTRNFDLQVNLKSGGAVKEYTFSGIERADYTSLYNFLSGKKIPIRNLQENGFAEDPGSSKPVYNEDEIYGGPDDAPMEDSEDEDFDEKAAAQEEEEGSDSDDSMDDDDLGSEVDEGLDSDLEEARKTAKKKKKAAAADSDDDDDDDNDEQEEAPKRKKKAKKDPNAPKRNMSAYMLYANATRSTVAEENPDAGFGEITKIIAANFKELSPEDRKEWDEKAAGDKKRYEAEMADYSAPEDDGDDEPAKKKSKKDPNAPKRAQSAYLYFSTTNRDRIKEANPDADFGEINKMLGAEWKRMDSDDKAKYEAMAKQDKARYATEMKSYSPVKGASTAASKKKAKDPNAPKRALTSFMFFSSEMRPKIKEEDPDLSFGDIGKKLGELFRALSPEEKEKYDAMARKDKDRYDRAMAAYKNQGSSAAAEDDDDDSDADGLNDDNDDDDDDDDDDSDDE